MGVKETKLLSRDAIRSRIAERRQKNQDEKARADEEYLALQQLEDDHAELLKLRTEMRELSKGYDIYSNFGLSEKEIQSNNNRVEGSLGVGLLALFATAGFVLLTTISWLTPASAEDIGYDNITQELRHHMNNTRYLEYVATSAYYDGGSSGENTPVARYAQNAVGAVQPLASEQANMTMMNRIPKPDELKGIPKLEETTIELAKNIKLDDSRSRENDIARIAGPVYLTSDQIAKLKQAETRYAIEPKWGFGLAGASLVTLVVAGCYPMRLRRREINRLQKFYDNKYGSMEPAKLLAIENYTPKSRNVAQRLAKTEAAIKQEKAALAALEERELEAERKRTEREAQEAQQHLERKAEEREAELRRLQEEKARREKMLSNGLATWNFETHNTKEAPGIELGSTSVKDVQDTVRGKTTVQDTVVSR